MLCSVEIIYCFIVQLDQYVSTNPYHLGVCQFLRCMYAQALKGTKVFAWMYSSASVNDYILSELTAYVYLMAGDENSSVTNVHTFHLSSSPV